MNFLMNLAIKTTDLINSFKILAEPGFNNQQIANDGGGSSNDFVQLEQATQTSDVAQKVTDILKTWIGPLFTLIGAIGAVYIVILAVQYAKSENDSKRAEVKTRIVNCIIGVISLLVIASLCFFVDWQALANIFGYASSGK